MVQAPDYATWVDIIDNIRAVYSGTLVYAANWDGYENVSFWDQMDLVGIDAYFPISNEENPSLTELVDGWSDYCFPAGSPYNAYGDSRDCHNWMEEIETWQITIDKPIVFTEIGYPGADYAAATPWIAGSHIPNCELQARCYEAVFLVFSDEDWFRGAFWWNWFPWSDAGGCCDLDFTPQNKPAESVLSDYYALSCIQMIPGGNLEDIIEIERDFQQNE